MSRPEKMSYPTSPTSPSSPTLPTVVPQDFALLTQVAEVWLPRVIVVIIYMGQGMKNDSHMAHQLTK